MIPKIRNIENMHAAKCNCILIFYSKKKAVSPTTHNE